MEGRQCRRSQQFQKQLYACVVESAAYKVGAV